jgi:hypothetical protein
MKRLERYPSREGIGFDSVSKLMIQASSIRNRFLHEASGWGATRQFATECINSTFALLQLFVSLHNTYVQPRLTNQRDGKATEQ